MTLFDNFKYSKELFTSLINPICNKYNITHMEYCLLIALYFNPNYDTASEIIKHQGFTKSHVSMTVKSLIDKKLIDREYRGNNQKTAHLILCGNYLDIIEDATRVHKEYVNILLQGFTDEERKLLINYLKRINLNVINYFNN